MDQNLHILHGAGVPGTNSVVTVPGSPTISEAMTYVRGCSAKSDPSQNASATYPFRDMMRYRVNPACSDLVSFWIPDPVQA